MGVAAHACKLESVSTLGAVEDLPFAHTQETASGATAICVAGLAAAGASAAAGAFCEAPAAATGASPAAMAASAAIWIIRIRSDRGDSSVGGGTLVSSGWSAVVLTTSAASGIVGKLARRPASPGPRRQTAGSVSCSSF